MNNKHFDFMLKAHQIAKKKLGFTFPNPVVGCIIVNNNRIIAKGVTASEGRPHAEEVALKKAGNKARGSSMYVTLEPCFHNSRNGSCAEQILRAGIKSIFIARFDPDLRTNKKSIAKLRKNRIEVMDGLTANKTNELNNFFFHSLKNKRPFVKVKMAISKDQKIAWSDYNSKWISNSKSRDFAHNIRLKSQAILTTVKTVIKDNPRFTVRKKNKIIKFIPTIIIDRLLKIPLNSKILKDISKKRIIIFTSSRGAKIEYLKRLGCEIVLMKKQKNKFYNMQIVLEKIYKLKINDILVEAGGIFFTNLLNKSLVDELHLFTSEIKIGDKGKQFIVNNQLEDYNFSEVMRKKFRNDIYRYLKIN